MPACGVLWGVATVPHTLSALKSLEREVGRPFDLVYHYHDINDVIPTTDEMQEAAAGRLLHFAIAARIYGAPDNAVTYQSIAAGAYDADLRRQAAGIAQLKVPVFVTFEQEANQHAKLGPRGTAAQFRAAWRHVHQVYEQAGATNAVWVWVMTGSAENLDRAGRLWPGNDVVDWISWNVYNQSGCGSGSIDPAMYEGFRQALAPFADWLRTTGPSLGIDVHKPQMVSELGSVLYADHPGRTARWYAAIPHVLARYPQVRAVTLWDSAASPACDYRIQRSAQVLAAVADAGRSAYVDRVAVRR